MTKRLVRELFQQFVRCGDDFGRQLRWRQLVNKVILRMPIDKTWSLIRGDRRVKENLRLMVWFPLGRHLSNIGEIFT